MDSFDIYDVILIGSGPANLFAAMEIIEKSKRKTVLILERARRLNDSRNISNGWFGGSARAGINMFLEPNFGGTVADTRTIDMFTRRLHKYSTANIKISKPKLLKRTIRRLEACGFQIDEPTTIPFSEDKMIKLGDFFHRELKQHATVLHKLNINAIHRVNGHFEISTNDGIFKGHNLLLGAGRGGAKWLQSIEHNLKLEHTNDSFDLGVRLEFPTQALQELFSKTPYFRLKFNKVFKTTVPTVQGAVETVETGDIKTSNGRSISATRNYTASMGLLKKFQSEDAHNEVYRLAEIVNVICDGQLLKEPINKLLTGNSVISPVAEFNSLSEGLRELTHQFPGLLQRCFVYAPEARLNAIQFKLSDSMESEINGLYVVGDMSGHTKSFVQAACSGIKAARHIQRKK